MSSFFYVQFLNSSQCGATEKHAIYFLGFSKALMSMVRELGSKMYYVTSRLIGMTKMQMQMYFVWRNEVVCDDMCEVLF